MENNIESLQNIVVQVDTQAVDTTVSNVSNVLDSIEGLGTLDPNIISLIESIRAVLEQLSDLIVS